MTALLQRALAEVGALPTADQDAIAARLLVELEDERGWTDRFAATTDNQWDRLVAEVRREVETGGTRSLTDVFPPEAE